MSDSSKLDGRGRGGAFGRSFFSELKLCLICGVYLYLNFYIFAIPPLVYYAWQGSLVPRLLVLLTVIDAAIPLRPGPRGRWVAFCKLTSMAEGFSYFDAECIVEGSYRKDKNYLVVNHPHALFGIAVNLWGKRLVEKYGTMPFFTVADIIFTLPLLRRLMVWWGATRVSAAPLKELLSQPYPHNVSMLQPGGVAEMFYGVDCEQIILEKRKGFCKVALQTGASLVPCYAFGANEIFSRKFGPHSLLAKLSSALRTSLVFWLGRWGVPYGFVPINSKLVVALGAPLDVERVAEPSREQVEALHARYCAALKDLFDRHKARMGPEWVRRRGELLFESGRSTTNTKGVTKGKTA